MEKTEPRTWVLVLCYQGRDHVAACLESLRAQQEPAGGVRCVVVDNASDDGSLEIVRTRFPEVEVVRNPRNLGFAGGNNAGIRAAMAAGAEYVALLNMDATVHPRWLVELVEAADAHPDAALLGARIYTADGRAIEFDGRQFDPVLTAGGYADRPPAPDPERVRESAYACGAGVLMRTSALAEVGLFDERFFAYHEDVELSLRCWRLGYRVLNVAGAMVFHHVGGAGAGVAFRDFMGLRNVVLTLLKHYDGESWRAHGETLAHFFTAPEARQRAASAAAALFDAPRALRRRRRLRTQARLGYRELVDRLAALGGEEA